MIQGHINVKFVTKLKILIFHGYSFIATSPCNNLKGHFLISSTWYVYFFARAAIGNFSKEETLAYFFLSFANVYFKKAVSLLGNRPKSDFKKRNVGF